METLLPYQKEHVTNLTKTLNKYKRALDASDTGTGKTYTSITLCKILKLRPFIICPKSVVSNWVNVLEHYKYKKNEYDVITYNELINNKLIKKEKNNEDVDYDWDINIYLFTMKHISVKTVIQLMEKY